MAKWRPRTLTGYTLLLFLFSASLSQLKHFLPMSHLLTGTIPSHHTTSHHSSVFLDDAQEIWSRCVTFDQASHASHIRASSKVIRWCKLCDRKISDTLLSGSNRPAVKYKSCVNEAIWHKGWPINNVVRVIILQYNDEYVEFMKLKLN